MKKNILNLVTISAMILAAVSCNKVKELPNEPTNVGKVLIPTTFVSGEYKSAEGDGSKVPYDVKDFMVTISQYDKDGVLTPVAGKKWRVGDMPAKVGLGVGKYAMRAVSYEGKQLEVSDIPYFFGEQDFTIAFDLETKLDLNIAVVDAKVSAEPTDNFNLAFTDWSVKVVSKADKTKQLFELNETTLEKYIKPAEVVLEIKGVRRNSPVSWNKTVSVDNVKSGDWIKTRLDVDAVGTVTVNIVVDNTLTEREIVIEIPNDDEDLGGGGTITPDPEEPDQPIDPEPEVKKPTVAGLNGLNIDEVLVVSKAAEAPIVQIKIDAETGGIQKLNVTLESQEEWFAAIIPGMFGGNSFDMANLVDGSAAKQNLLELGIITKDTVIKGEKSYIFDISMFMGLLAENNPITNSYDFTIAVEDGEGNTASKKLVVRVTK